MITFEQCSLNLPLPGRGSKMAHYDEKRVRDILIHVVWLAPPASTLLILTQRLWIPMFSTLHMNLNKAWWLLYCATTRRIFIHWNEKCETCYFFESSSSKTVSSFSPNPVTSAFNPLTSTFNPRLSAFNSLTSFYNPSTLFSNLSTSAACACFKDFISPLIICSISLAINSRT